MPHFVLLYDYVPNVVERRAPFRPAHLELYREWRSQGRLVMGGAIGDPPHGALIVFDVASADEVEDFAAADPYVANGIVTGRRVEPWAVVS
ncbi:MAG: hypothetical protein QOC77_2877 [Thermoleophilaceae bacterium]|nr:hypothetical protein [Thermoleophilaceae bacterium]MEA2471771.1 hypothetical protein [Thermoleophilaceae bacterium]